MKLTFLGTRGCIEARSRLHRMHSCCCVSYRGRGVLIDCGEDWAGRLEELRPRTIVLTHAHPDHAWALKGGAPCPVYATPESWEAMEGFGIEDARTVRPREPFEVRGIAFEAFPVLHSTRCPAVGYRIGAGRVDIFYGPDLLYIEDRAAALGGAKLYVGDGATVTRSMVRRSGGTLIGHVPIRTQLTWCQKEGVGRAIFTHCGSEIVAGDERSVGAEVRGMAEERGVEAQIARDGMELVLRG